MLFIPFLNFKRPKSKIKLFPVQTQEGGYIWNSFRQLVTLLAELSNVRSEVCIGSEAYYSMPGTAHKVMFKNTSHEHHHNMIITDNTFYNDHHAPPF